MPENSNGSSPFPGTLKSLRRQRSWSQKKLAELLGVSEDTIKHWEGGSTLPNFQNRQRLSELFEMEAEKLGFVKEESSLQEVEAPATIESGPLSAQSDSSLPEGVEGGKEDAEEQGVVAAPIVPEAVQSSPLPYHMRLHEQNRRQMLATLRHDYEAILKNSLQDALWIELDLAERSGAVSNAANLLLRIADQRERALPAGTSIMQVYEEARQKLLILGAAGVGKSTLLTKLALYLIAQAESSGNVPLPVIVPLSTWATHRLPLEVWLGEQISQIYHISRQLSHQWVHEWQFIPLLDGLDEMDEIARPACIAALNSYLRTYQGPVVVCSRAVEYEVMAQRERLRMQNAVVVQPLTPRQIDVFLSQAGKAAAELRQAIGESGALQDLATRPLMLNLLLFTYKGMAIQQLQGSDERLQQQVLHDYVEHVIARKGDSKRYPSARTNTYLSWLALQMHKHNQTVFYLEHLQPGWLPVEHYRPLYKRLSGDVTSIFIGLLMSLALNAFLFGAESFANNVLFGVTGGLIGWLMNSGRKEIFSLLAVKDALKQRWQDLLRVSILAGLLVGLPIGVVYALWPPEGYSGGLARGLIAGGGMFASSFVLTFLVLAGKRPGNGWPLRRSRWAILGISPMLRSEHIELGLFTGLLLGTGIGINAGLSMGISSILSYTIIGIFLSLILLGKENTIELKETVSISARMLIQKQHLFSTLFVFLVIFLFYGLGVWLQYDIRTALIYGFSGALSTSVLYWAFIGLWLGISQETLDDQDRVRLNQGIRYSLRNAFLIGLLASGISLLVGSFSDILDYEVQAILEHGFASGLPIGLTGGLEAIGRDLIFFELFGAVLPTLFTGGLTWCHHYLLRWLLYRAGVAPLRYKHFLDDAMQRILVYRVGGGYRFIHRTLLNYFAEKI